MAGFRVEGCYTVYLNENATEMEVPSAFAQRFFIDFNYHAVRDFRFKVKNVDCYFDVTMERRGRRGRKKFYFTDGWQDFIQHFDVSIGSLMKFEMDPNNYTSGPIVIDVGWMDLEGKVY